MIDSVAGLGEALVSGHAAADHDEWLRAEDRWERTERASEDAVLTVAEREAIAADALRAERAAGEPLDLEWAIGQDGRLAWLQARPITTLGPDPQALDTPVEDPVDVHTRCNVGEMMPGAVAPLTYSTCARGIDEGWLRMQDEIGLARPRGRSGRYIAMSHGHLFIDMSEGARISADVTGADADQQSLALCGRVVPDVATPPPAPLWRRVPRLVRQLLAVLRPGPRIRHMEMLVARGDIALAHDGRATWRAIDRRLTELFDAYHLHLTVSAGAGALAAVLLQRLAGGGEPSDEDHAVVAAVLSGASDVESADIAEGATRVLESILAEGEAASAFAALELDAAVDWLEGGPRAEVVRSWRDYLARHGHRSLRELDVRQPEWRHDPSPLVRSLQTQVRGSLERAKAPPHPPSTPPPASGPPAAAARFDRLRGIAHAAVRNRERSKSLLVAETVLFKRAYRALGEQLVAERRLPDVDALYFLLHEEIGIVAGAAAGHPLVAEALGRREAFAYQQTLVFPEVAVGRPQPLAPARPADDARVIVGKPVSRGRAEGRVRVVERLEEAESLKPGEILVAPITDVGWTPYFAVIGGLVTDVGSAVSHGAVVAREYGLPAVLNTKHATRSLRTGERVVIDGDRGTVERLDVEADGGDALGAQTGVGTDAGEARSAVPREEPWPR